jgi:hypothetical protein
VTQCDARTAIAEFGDAGSEHVRIAAKQMVWDLHIRSGATKFEANAAGVLQDMADAGAELLIVEYPTMRNMLDVRRLANGCRAASIEVGMPVVLCVPAPMIDTMINDHVAAAIHVSAIYVPGRGVARCTSITAPCVRQVAD